MTRREVQFLVHTQFMEKLRRWAPANGVPLVDVIRVLDQDRETLLTCVHRNPKGNRIIAQELAKEILAQLSIEKFTGLH